MPTRSLVDPPTRPASTFALLVRGVVSAHVAVLVVQLALALAFIGGCGEAYVAHTIVAWLVGGLGIVQVLVLFGPATRNLYRAMAVAIVPAEAALIWLAQAGHTGAHVTLAMVVWTLSLAILIAAWGATWGRAARP